MKCNECKWYIWDINYNYCKRFGFECYSVFNNCTLVNDDGSDNEKEINENGDWLP